MMSVARQSIRFLGAIAALFALGMGAAGMVLGGAQILVERGYLRSDAVCGAQQSNEAEDLPAVVVEVRL